MQPTINSRGLSRLPEFLEEHSIAGHEFISHMGISSNLPLQAGNWLPRDLCCDLLNQSAYMTGDPLAGTKIGAAVQLSDLGKYGNQIMAAPTILDALQVATRYSTRLHRGSEFHLGMGRKKLSFSFRFCGEMSADPHHFVSGTLVVMRNIALLVGETDGMSVQMTAPYSTYSHNLEEFLGPTLEFGKNSNTIIINRELLDLPLAPLQSPKTDVYESPIVAETVRLISEMLPEGEAKLSRIADHLCISERTLQRRLDRNRTLFTDLLDTIRRNEAIRLVELGQSRLSDIALTLGYSDQSNFNRAFRRWTNDYPKHFQKLKREE